MQIYEKEAFKRFTEEDQHNFNRTIVSIERILKIITVQTLTIDSLERKIFNLSKRNPTGDSNMIAIKQDPKIMALVKQ
jgi:hypothetical protein